MNNPSPTLYQLGKGILYIAEWVGTVPGAYRDVGNCPDMNVVVTEEKLEHYSSRTSTRKKDAIIIYETGYTINFILEEVSLLNLKMFLRGTSSANVIHANMDTGKEYAIKFISVNAHGPNEIWEFWKVSLSPNGEFSLIQDTTLSKMSFTGEGLDDSDNHATSPFFDVTYITTTSTSSSSTTTTTT